MTYLPWTEVKQTRDEGENNLYICTSIYKKLDLKTPIQSSHAVQQ